MGSVQRARMRLEDRWESSADPVLMTGIQALVRLPLEQRALDRAAGHDTAGFVTGYRGSPLGVYDKELQKQARRLEEAGVVFQPGLNEDLAATAAWGSQQSHLFGDGKKDGVFAIWYGKGPGVDRSGDALRHANMAGTAPLGGVLALAGDDPSAKSSTVANASDHAFMDLEIPFLDPSGVGEILEFGLKGIALSRFAGTWAAMKCVADTMDASATFRIDPAWSPVIPEGDFEGEDGRHIRLRDIVLAQERRLRLTRLPAAIAFARANGLDRVVLDSPRPRFGIAARGKAYATLRQAMLDLGIDDTAARLLGLRIWKVGLAWPLDAEAARAFAQGLEEVLVVEDRRSFLEAQLRDALYGLPGAPRITGKRGADGAPLLSELTELDAAAVARALDARLPREGRPDSMAARLASLKALAEAARPPLALRQPWFCPGCPHNSSTKVPEGSRAMAGIGCHYMATWMDRDTEVFTQMGGEGAPWLGQMAFVNTPHVFANLGDGTYSHSGSLAVRAAVAAKASITYKILVNGAVAMTGGQTPEAEMTVPRIAAQMAAEGVAAIAVVSDDPARHQDDPLMPGGVAFHHRDRLDAVQKELRGTKGVTILIYDQECATERRRHRKRGTAAKATRRVVINPRVCEDCGDCGVQSNCLAVQPVQTEFGQKRAIDQSACNQDFSCLKGFCPSFVTLEGAEVAAHPEAVSAPAVLPEPVLPALRGEAWNVVLAGIGGQGVTALSAILAMAAHVDGRPVRSMDQLGLAQKGGGVQAQLRIGAEGAAPETLAGPRIGAGQADLLIAADAIGAHGAAVRPLLSPDRTASVVNAELAATAGFLLGAPRAEASPILENLRAVSRDLLALPAAHRVEEALGDVIFLNVFLLGTAWQRGLLPLSLAAIERALELNGTAVERNKQAFALGRAAALEEPAGPPAPETLDALVARRVADLTAYQNAAYARRYADAVAQVRAAPGADEALARAVAIQLHRLMAYKDEYEVARLHADAAWQASLDTHFTGTRRKVLHLAPPVLSRPDPDTGRPVKRSFGPWMIRAMGLLRHGKILRGTALDPFGRTEERRTERALIEEFRAGLDAMLPRLDATTRDTVREWVEAWGGIRGFGPVKEANIARTRPRLAAIAARLDAPAMPMAAE
ncbi:indolepyruvate ferredoxin oxidoreductase family protein [Roseomonas sp. SSH11]|uniref:Indolepyruvate ferredoxin oxidoreductase family protein n=1 Tax=Pararoseomonas baculiformis TaxID=2820812 RepID=A0ABS4AGG1_9PROT|nr:indolepyruvate ferredoxin oxidoreductase family protein [Pararoseomonas baculiformis]MBP0445613.1 indolepyruvate ferredoxin oxidoreductase family protein [Pararoseomonas baculiformis]